MSKPLAPSMPSTVLILSTFLAFAAAIGRFPANPVKVGICYQRYVTTVSCLRCATAATCPGNLNCCSLVVAPGIKCCSPALHAQSQVHVPDNPGRRDLAGTGANLLERAARWRAALRQSA